MRIDQSLATSLLSWATIDGVISLNFEHPDSFMVSSSSSLRILSTFPTPSAPSQAKPQSIGRPTKTILAPRARHLNTSEPVLMPPSMKTGHLPLMALVIGSKTSIYGNGNECNN